MKFIPRPQAHEAEARAKVWATDPIPVRVHTLTGTAEVLITLRVDGRHAAREGWRVDVSSLFAWESVDGGEGPKTRVLAQRLAAKWLAAAREQETLMPVLK